MHNENNKKSFKNNVLPRPIKVVSWGWAQVSLYCKKLQMILNSTSLSLNKYEQGQGPQTLTFLFSVAQKFRLGESLQRVGQERD